MGVKIEMGDRYKRIKQHISEIIERHRLWLNSSGKNGRRAIFSGTGLNGVDLASTDLSGANFFIADLKGSNLDGVNLSGANLKFANLKGASLRNSNLSLAELSSANLEEADLSEAIFYGANLGYANLKSSKLISADFQYANFEKVDLRESILIGSKLVHLKNAHTALWNDATLTLATIDRDTYKNIPSEIIDLYGDSFEAHGREAKIKRSFVLSRDCYQAGFLLLGYLSTVIREMCPNLEAEISIEQDDPRLQLYISTFERDRRKIEQILKKYSLVLKGELRPNKLMPGSVFTTQFENQLEIARMALRLAGNLPKKYKNHNRTDAESMDGKLKHLLHILADGLYSPDATVKAAINFGGENMPYISDSVKNLKDDVRELIKQSPNIEFEFSILSDLFRYPEPSATDIRKAKIALAMVNEKEPQNFLKIIKTVRDCSNQIPQSNWPAIISETVNRYF
jgi:hypothetical protein